VSPDRAWRAFHANWLFFAVLSHAGVTFVAVQRGHDSAVVASSHSVHGSVRRLSAGSLRFLLLSLLVGRGHVFWWAHEAPPIPRRQRISDPLFITVRDIVVFGLIVA
jgi:hypothetical protein